MVTAWKTQLYPKAWAYMEACKAKVTDPGYIENVWGRRRRFAFTQDQSIKAAMERECSNFPIQSAIADTCMIALCLLNEQRRLRHLHFKIINQIHDAILFEVPEHELTETKELANEIMSTIAIPIPDAMPLKLGVDLSVMTRWGEKAHD